MEAAEVTEMVLFICIMCLWLLYMLAYFTTGAFVTKLPSFGRWKAMGMWHTAMKTREIWARDLMAKADDAAGAALLAVQQMRNMIVACTLLVMGISQIMGRLVVVMLSDANLNTIDSLVRQDPMIGPASWPPAYVRVSVPFGACLASLLCFGQAVRLAIHIGFNIRVEGITQNDPDFNLDQDIDKGEQSHRLFADEIVLMLQRCEVFFTLGLRFLYLFIGTIFWTLGITALLVSSLGVLIALAVSDVLFVPRRKASHSAKALPPPTMFQTMVTAHPAGVI